MAAKGPAKEPGKGPPEGASKATAEEGVFDDLPSSSATSGFGRYLRVGDDLFIHLPGASRTKAPIKGEVFDAEVLTAAGLKVVEEPSVGGDGS